MHSILFLIKIGLQIITENEELHYSKRESIINDLKQKGFNELQIDDIFHLLLL